MAGSITLALLPTYFEMRAERTARESVLGALNVSDADSARSEREKLSSTKKRSTALLEVGTKQQVSDAILLAVSEKPKGVTIRSFVYDRKGTKPTLVVSGKASDGALFKTYTDILKSKALYEKVSVPLAALANLEGGDFAITMTGAF